MRFKCLQQPVSKSHWIPCDSMKFNWAKQNTLCSSHFPQIPILSYFLFIVAFISYVYPLCYQILSEHYVLVQSPACASLYVSLLISLPKGFVFNLSGIQGWTLLGKSGLDLLKNSFFLFGGVFQHNCISERILISVCLKEMCFYFYTLDHEIQIGVSDNIPHPAWLCCFSHLHQILIFFWNVFSMI